MHKYLPKTKTNVRALSPVEACFQQISLNSITLNDSYHFRIYEIHIFELRMGMK